MIIEPETNDGHPEQLALSVDQAARLLGVSRDLVYSLVAQRQLASVRLGRRILVPRWALDAVVGPPDSDPP